MRREIFDLSSDPSRFYNGVFAVVDARGKITTDLDVEFDLMYSLSSSSSIEPSTDTDGAEWYAAKAVEEPEEVMCGCVRFAGVPPVDSLAPRS